MMISSIRPVAWKCLTWVSSGKNRCISIDGSPSLTGQGPNAPSLFDETKAAK